MLKQISGNTIFPIQFPYVTNPNPLTSDDLSKLSYSKKVLFACFCAEQVLHLVMEVDKPVCLRAIQTAYLFLEGKATKEDCSAASHAASYASYTSVAASYAAVAASYAYAAASYTSAAASYAASYAASCAALGKDKQAIIDAQWDFYDQLLNGDRYFEEIVLSTKIS